jgi:hypothetical protein
MPPQPDRAPSAELRCLAHELAHGNLAEVLRRGVPVNGEEVGVAEGCSVKVVIFICPHVPQPLPPEVVERLMLEIDQLRVSEGRPPRAAEVAPWVAPHATGGPTPLDAAILALLRRSGPLKGSAIARRLGRDASYVRRRLAAMRRAGLVRNAGDGYEACGAT